MLSVLSKGFRVKAAIAVAALYALCILAPTAAFALSHNPGLAHCLAEDHGTATVHAHGGKVHVHVNGTTHDGDTGHKHAGNDGKTNAVTCCGLFSVVAIASDPELSLGLSTTASVLMQPLREALIGRGPDRINRPPISLPSL